MRALAVALATLSTVGAGHKHKQGCRTHACYHRVALKLAARLGPHYWVNSTCYAQGGATASGQTARFGIVAVLPGFLRLGTRIRLDRPAFGRRDFVVLDHIGSGSQLDIFYPSEARCIWYGRRVIGFRVVHR